MDKNNNDAEIARGIAQNLKSMSPLDCNIIAMLTAQILAEGKSKCELQNISQFLQLLLLAVKTYIY